MNAMGHRAMPRRSAVYGNVLVKGPDGTPLFRCDAGKANFYLRKNLATKVAENGTGSVIQLTFMPGGPGRSMDDPYFLAPKYNRCVVEGREDNLSRHHIVPACYWRHFPAWVRTHNEYDLVPLCVSCHDQYETVADELKRELAEEYNAPGRPHRAINRITSQLRSAANALMRYGDQLPPARAEELRQLLKDFYPREATIEDEGQLIEHFAETHHRTNVGRFIASQLTTPDEINDFIVRWRTHFIETMDPAFMPEHWSIERRVYPGHLRERDAARL